ncbi:helix-turn-helix transcriptional regulator [Pseudoxanthomonas sp. LjRoot143]|uniref:helix-turn-helix domain-containing protein n=1 Tax=Pseudoxanthomonas sp. LjRoot143 TaxID=3342266 RepID=UPI003ECFC1F5
MKLNAERIRTLREQRAWSQEHLATVAGVSTRTLQRIEAGSAASKETCLALAAALEVQMSAIVGESTATDVHVRPTLAKSANVAASWLTPVVLLVCLMVWFGYNIGKDMADRDNRATAECLQGDEVCDPSRRDIDGR